MLTSNARNPGSLAHSKLLKGVTQTDVTVTPLHLPPEKGTLRITYYLGGSEGKGPPRGWEGPIPTPFVTSHLTGRQKGNRMGCPRYRKLAMVVQWVRIIKVFLQIANKTQEGS